MLNGSYELKINGIFVVIYLKLDSTMKENRNVEKQQGYCHVPRKKWMKPKFEEVKINFGLKLDKSLQFPTRPGHTLS